MKLGCNSNLYAELPFSAALEKLQDYGFTSLTFGIGGLEHLPEDHCNAEVLLEDKAAFREFEGTISKYGFSPNSIGCQSNPLHPRKEIAARDDHDLRLSVLMAERLGMDRINVFSGCPGGGPDAKYPNWVAYNWPRDFSAMLQWQWNESLIPYWKDFVKFAKQHGVDKIGMEFHPNWLVYNTDTLLRLREAVGPEIGVCLDPSHLFWMGMDPVVVIDKLSDCIFQVHGKDTMLIDHKIKENGVIETHDTTDLANRAYSFGIPGDGHDLQVWKGIVRALLRAGYDRDICFEHEDCYMDREEGIARGVAFLKQALIDSERDNMFWKMRVGAKKYPYLD